MSPLFKVEGERKKAGRGPGKKKMEKSGGKRVRTAGSEEGGGESTSGGKNGRRGHKERSLEGREKKEIVKPRVGRKKKKKEEIFVGWNSL